MSERLAAASAEFSFNTVHIDRVAISEQAVIAKSDRGEFSAQRLVMSSRAHAPIEGMESDFGETERPTVVNSLVLKIIGGEAKLRGICRDSSETLS